MNMAMVVVVSRPGPPLVVAITASKTLRPQASRRDTFTEKAGMIMGTVMRVNWYHLPAPSTLAAS